MYSASLRVLCFSLVVAASTGSATVILACGDSETAPPKAVSLGDSGGFVDVADPDANKNQVEGGGFRAPDGGVIRADRFVTTVVSFAPGPCAGFGGTEMPAIVLGPPVGAGDLKNGLDVVSLGVGGELVLSFDPNAIVDGPGPDFIVFENAFYGGGDKSNPSADPAEVSVSEDGTTWKTYECPPGAAAPPYGKCAGWHPVYSAPGNGISPIDPEAAGGEAYDLAELGLTTARFVRMRDKSSATCDGPPGQRPNNSGFDLDAIAIIHAKDP
jgi:hypothetical protein